MRLALIDFYIRNQKLSKIGPKLVADSINYVDCSFTFRTDDWNGIDKWVVLKKGEESYRVNLVNDSIPEEAGLNLGAGLWFVSLFGENAEGTKRITTNSVTVEVAKSAVPEGGPLPVIELTEAEQIAAKAQKALDTANEVLLKAENGDFDGLPGKTPNIQIGEVLTLAAGEKATASITGTAEEPRLNLGIPQGEPGKDGEGGGSGAEVTAESIEVALGYVPANPKDIPTVPTNVSAFNNDAGYAKKTELPTKTSELSNDSGFITAEDIPAPPEIPVKSVNGKTGAVVLSATDVGADEAGKAAEEVGKHNTSENAHNDIRVELTELRNALEAFLDIDDPTLDQLSELIQKIEANAGTITELTSGKVNVADIVNNLTTNVVNKPLSAAQGVVLKGLVDELDTAAKGAKSTAETAETTADEAKSLATTANTNANTAKTTAQNASDKVNNLEERMDSGEFKGEPGTPGANGYTPVYGVDYMTPEDKAEIEAYIATELAKRGQLKPEYAESLEWLEENGDQSKMYVLPDGFIYAYKLTKTEVESGPSYTNALDGTTKHINQRWSRSSEAYSTANGYMATDLLPVSHNQVVYTNLSRKAFLGNYARIFYLDANNNYCGTKDTAAANCHIITTENGKSSFVVGYEMATNDTPSTNAAVSNANSIAKIMLVFNMSNEIHGSANIAITEADVADLIVSIGNPIEEGGGTTVVEEYKWSNTNLAFVPADYGDIVADHEKRIVRNTEEIAALKKTVENGGLGVLTEAEKLEKIKTWDKPVYDHAEVTLIADGKEKPALTTNDRTIAAIYAKYRALMAAHPDFITETNLGKCTASDTFTAVDMLRFDFKERDGLTQPDLGESALHETKPKLIFMSGVHTEWVGVWGLYYALEEIVTNPAFDDIRRNCHIIVVPCANPFALTSQTAIEGWRMSHVNANGVAIHNNFNVDHSTSGNVGEYNYGGTAPCSELETQYIDKIMADNPDAVAFISCHNNDYSTYYGSHVIWASSATYHMCNVVFRLVDKMSKAWINKYGQTLKDAIDNYKINMDADDYRLGRATMSTSKGTEQKNALKYGIQGVNVEISRMMKIFSGNTDGTSEVMTHGAEVYANLIRTILMAYENNDKKAYYE